MIVDSPCGFRQTTDQHDRDDANIFCTQCGQRLPAILILSQPNAFCTKCGRKAGPTDRFCGDCGTSLTQSLIAKPVISGYFPPELWEIVASFVPLSQLPLLFVLSKRIHSILTSDFVWHSRVSDLSRSPHTGHDANLGPQISFLPSSFEMPLQTRSRDLLRLFCRPLTGFYFNSGFSFREKVGVDADVEDAGGADGPESAKCHAYSYYVHVGSPKTESGEVPSHLQHRFVSFQDGESLKVERAKRSPTNSLACVRLGNLVGFVQDWPFPPDFKTAACGHVLPSGTVLGSWSDSYGQRGLFHMRCVPEDDVIESRIVHETEACVQLNWSHPEYRDVRDDFFVADGRTVYEWTVTPLEENQDTDPDCVLFQHPKGLFVFQKKSVRKNFFFAVGLSSEPGEEGDLMSCNIVGTAHLGRFSGFYLSKLDRKTAYFFVEMPLLHLEVDQTKLVARGLLYTPLGIIGRIEFRVAKGEFVLSHDAVLAAIAAL